MSPAIALDRLVAHVRVDLDDDGPWLRRLDRARRVHLAVFVEPFLGHIFSGKKTVESRFAMNRSAPFESASPGDVVLLKQSSGPVAGVAELGVCEFRELAAPGSWDLVRSLAREICVDESFLAERAGKRFVSLMRVAAARGLADPIRVDKRDRRPWVVL